MPVVAALMLGQVVGGALGAAGGFLTVRWLVWRHFAAMKRRSIQA